MQWRKGDEKSRRIKDLHPLAMLYVRFALFCISNSNEPLHKHQENDNNSRKKNHQKSKNVMESSFKIEEEKNVDEQKKKKINKNVEN